MARSADADRLARDGFVVLRGFYDVDRELAPIQEGIQRIVQLVAGKYGIDAPAATPEEAMRRGYPAIAAVDRAYGGEVYDAVKHLPAFVALAAGERNAKLFSSLRTEAMAGLAVDGFGIRIDNPNEDRFRSWWHQEFPAQMRSIDGVTFWSPLVAVSEEMGPVQIARASHKLGLIPTINDDGGEGRSGYYAYRIENDLELVSRYDVVAPLTAPGDLIVLDYLVLHQSGYNVSDGPRWSMQMRYFNYRDPLGQRIQWRKALRPDEALPEVKSAGDV